jgi:SAM-dependent methyltransferase
MVTPLYDAIGKRYHAYRLPDKRIAALISRELDDARRVVNIGAGAGSYEPADREVVAVEPSRVMIDERRGRTGAAVVCARAESLPFRQDAFDCATAILTIHHWSDIERGLSEALRVAKGKIVLLTWIGFTSDFWLLDYFPEIGSIDEPLFPSIERLSSLIGPVRSVVVPIPHDCTDGFLCAYWRRPEAYLDEGKRSAISTFSRVDGVEEGLARLKDDLSTGRWRERYGDLLEKDEIDFGYRLVVSGEDTI